MAAKGGWCLQRVFQALLKCPRIRHAYSTPYNCHLLLYSSFCCMRHLNHGISSLIHSNVAGGTPRSNSGSASSRISFSSQFETAVDTTDHTDDNKDKNEFMKFLKSLEEAKDNGDYQMAISLFHDFQMKNPSWIRHWPAQKIAATILHVYFKAGLHEQLLMLHENMIDNGLQHGEGIYRTLIKCCLSQRNWEGALRYFKMSKENGLRNIRIYSDLIKTFIRNKQLHHAVELFEEMQTMELNQKTRKQLNDQEMMILLIDASIERASFNKTDDLADQIVNSVLCYVRERCLPVSHGLSQVIFKWIGLKPDWSGKVTESDSLGSTSKFLDAYSCNIRKETAHFMTVIKSNLQNSRQVGEFKVLSEFLDEQGPFDVVIDGANVMLAAQKDKKTGKTILQTENLMQLIKNTDLGDKKIVIILPEILNKKSNFSKSEECEFLLNLEKVKIFWSNEISDDLTVIYAALKSELSKTDSKEIVRIITNDSLRDHIPLAKTEQLKFLRWIRYRQFKFYWDEQHRMSIKKIWLVPFQSKNLWILTREDGKMMQISYQI